MTKSTQFIYTLEQALDHVNDVAWLEAQSPLAQPYVLQNSSASRGTHLKSQLHDAASRLDPSLRTLLETAYFKRDQNLNIVGVTRVLNMSRAAFYRHRDSALHSLALEYSRMLRPAIRLENIPTPPALPLRTAMTELVWQQLCTRVSVSLVGASGMGKTCLAASLAKTWAQRWPCFWYTLRPPLNDQWISLAFALGTFLHAFGASGTLQQLIADDGTSDPARMLGLLRHDLASLQKPVLLCIDEVDLLCSDTREHARITQMLNALADHSVLLGIGQQAVLETQATHVVTRVSVSDAQLMLPDLPPQELERALQVTRGSPAMLKLMDGMLTGAKHPEDVFGALQHAPSLEQMVRRAWIRFGDPTRDLLARLSIFRNSAPRDAFADVEDEVQHLCAQDLLRDDGLGGLTIPSYVREFVQFALPVESRMDAHLLAAIAFEKRAQFTTAAFHFLAAHEPDRAVLMWFANRAIEKSQGRAPAAAAIFAETGMQQLTSKQAKQAFVLMRAEWSELNGDGAGMLSALEHAAHAGTPPAPAYLALLRGRAHEMRGNLDEAQAQYADALEQLKLQHETHRTALHSALGYVHYRNHDIAPALVSALRAQVNAQSFRGSLELQAGNIPLAEHELGAALNLSADARVGPELRADVLSRLGALYWQTARPAMAREVLTESLRIWERIGNQWRAQHVRLNLAAAALTAGDPTAAMQQAEAGLNFATLGRHAYLVAGHAINASEAHLALGDPSRAIELARLAIAQEEAPTLPAALIALGRATAALDQDADPIFARAISIANGLDDPISAALARFWRAHFMTSGEERDAARKHVTQTLQKLGISAPATV